MATERERNRLDDAAIRRRLRAGERFELSDGDGLTLAYRDGYKTPVWRLRYRIGGERGRDGKEGKTGTPRVMVLGKYKDMSLAKARAEAKQLRADVTKGIDVAAAKRERQREALAKIEAARNVYTVGQLADEYFEAQILGRWKHPDIVRARIEKDIRPSIGKLPAKDVKPRHIDEMLTAIVKRGAPTIANDVLRWTRRMFNYAVKRELVDGNPASAFDLSDAGGKEEPRDRWLSRDELVELFEAMRKTPGLSTENFHTVKLLLMLAVRKGELTNARVAEFDLDKAVWRLPDTRTKTGAALDIPLPHAAVESLRELVRLGEGSEYLLPARKAQERMLPYIHENTLNVALAKVRRLMPKTPRFTIHDFRRTARSHLSALKVSDNIAERCLNHKIGGVKGVYDRHECFDERREALSKWAAVVVECETPKTASTAASKRKVPRGR
jgi:integrase